MIVSTQNGDRGELFDATGKKIGRKTVWANLVTGECVVFKEPAHTVVGESGGEERAKEWMTFPAPLTFRSIK